MAELSRIHMSDHSRNDDDKRTEVVSFKITERMALDLMRLANSRDRSISNLLYCAARRWLYGDIVSLDGTGTQTTTGAKVDD